MLSERSPILTFERVNPLSGFPYESTTSNFTALSLSATCFFWLAASLTAGIAAPSRIFRPLRDGRRVETDVERAAYCVK